MSESEIDAMSTSLDALAQVLDDVCSNLKDQQNFNAATYKRLTAHKAIFCELAEAIKELIPDSDTFKFAWVFQRILGEVNRIDDTDVLQASALWRSRGDSLLTFVAKISYAELSLISSSGRH